MEKAPNDAPLHRDAPKSTKPHIDDKGQGQICEKPLFFDGVPNKKIIYHPIGLRKAPNDAPSHNDASKSTKSHIEVKRQGHICKTKVIFLRGTK